MIEKVTKKGDLTIPHAHGIICVHPQTVIRFRNLLTDHSFDEESQTESCTLTPRILRKTIGIIHSIQFHEIYDLNGWLMYCTKQVEDFKDAQPMYQHADAPTEGNPEHPSGVFNDSEAYDPISDSWTLVRPMRTRRHGTGAASLDGAIYIPGGAAVEAFGALHLHERYLP